MWLLVLRDDPEPVSVTRAVGAFRERGGGTGVEGVYVYATRGFEEVDALFGSRHEYPATTTITFAATDDCRALRWDALDGRSTTWRICPAGSGWGLAGYDEEHTFVGTTERTVYRCRRSTWLPEPARSGDPAARMCSTGDTDESGSGSVAGRDPVTVGNASVDAIHIRLATNLTGRTRGMGTFDSWLEPETGLPVRLAVTNDNRSASPIGDVRYVEELVLELQSLDPRR